MNLPGAGCWASVPEDRKRKSLYQGMLYKKKEEKVGPGILMLKMKRNKLWTYAKVLEENLYTCLFENCMKSVSRCTFKNRSYCSITTKKCIWAVNKLLYV